MSENTAYTTITPNVKYNSFNQLKYLIKQEIMGINTLKVCQVVKVNADNTLNIKNMVCRLDAQMKPIEPIVWENVPILRTQGGTSGFQIAYNVGDIVLVGFCDRDYNAVKRSKAQAAPSTLLPFPLSSGIVLGAIFFEEQNIYVKVSDKIYLFGNTEITGNLEVSGKTEIGGKLEVKSDIEAKSNLEVTGDVKAATYTVGTQAGASLTFVDAGGNTHTVVNGIIVS